MISKWSKSGEGESLSQKVIDKVKPEIPLKTKIETAQKKLQFQISKLESITEKLQKKHDFIFSKIVDSQRTNNFGYAKAYAVELHEIRKMKNMISSAKLAMEQINVRLNTISELGDVVVTLSPCMSVIKGLSASLGGLMPEANSSMQELSKMLGDVLSDSSMANNFVSSPETSTDDTLAILEEAHEVIEGKTRQTIPELPNNLQRYSKQTREELI